MCGILGFYPAHLVNRASFSSALELIGHRGPDYKGEAEINQLLFGHVRLSIVDLDHRSNQPMHDSSRCVWVVFNGEIYNFLDLKKELAGTYTFITQSDTEVILAAYLKWGCDAISRLDGMFALSIYDLKRNELILARDRIGKKPLYYGFEGRAFAFGSEVRSIQRLLPGSVTIDEVGLNNYFARGFVGSERSIFSQIKKLPPGCLLRLDLSSLEEIGSPQQYWKLPVADEATRNSSEGVLVERLNCLLERATISRLVADVPIGCFLSGGLDSSLIAAIAARHYPGKLKTFTVTFSDHAVDESKYANEIANYLGTDHHELHVGDNLVDEIPKLIAGLDEPFADSSFIPTYFICREARREVAVCLSGDGGDELLAGYGHYDDFSREMQMREILPSWLRRNIGNVAQVLPERHKTRSLKRLAFDDHLDGFVAYYTNFFCFAEREKLFAGGVFSVVKEPEEEIYSFYRKDLNWVENVCQSDFRSYLVDDILVKVDRMSMLNSLEVRSPLLDRAIAEFCFSELPSKYKMNRSVKKYLLKQLGKRYLPDTYKYDRKQGFSVPLASWFKGQLGDCLMDLIHSQHSGLFNKNYVVDLMNSHRLGMSNYSKKLFCVLVWEIWYSSSQVCSANRSRGCVN